MSHLDTFDRYTHAHRYLGERHERNARRTWVVVALTASMMLAEIAAGLWTGSMALLADGIHMATHAGALGIAALAYGFAYRHRDNGRFSFGTGKVGDLAGYSSALILAMVALAIGVESLRRLANPVPIAFDEAILVAVLGLAVNLASAWLLGDGHHHAGHDDHVHHDHDHRNHDHRDHRRHDHHHADHNLRSAYFHVLADALTSVLAIVALVLGRWLGWLWMDPLMGIIGAVVIARWSYGLLRDTSAVLLDASAPEQMKAAIRERLEIGDVRIADLHVWRVGPGHHAAIVSLVTHHPQPPAHYKSLLRGLDTLDHVSIEVQACGDHSSPITSTPLGGV